MPIKPRNIGDVRLKEQTIRNMQRKQAPKKPQLKSQTVIPMSTQAIQNRKSQLKKPQLKQKTKRPMNPLVIKDRKNKLKKPKLLDQTIAPMSTEVIQNRRTHLKKPKLNNSAKGLQGGPAKNKPQLNSKTKQPMNPMVIKDRKNKIKKPKLDSATKNKAKAKSDQKYPPAGFLFKVEVDGFKDETSFKEVSGLTVEREIEMIIEGGNNDFVHKVPKGATKYNNLVLKRGLVAPQSPFAKWCLETLQSMFSEPIKPKNIHIELQDTHDSKPLMKWSFTNAWPVKWEVSGFDSQKSEIVIESIEFAYNSFSAA